MAFPLSRLPNELVLEIIRVACIPGYEDVSARRPSYATAVVLAAVSHAIRAAAMPHLLHTVVLASLPQLSSFVNTILLHRQLSAASSSLVLDHAKLVRRFWSTEAWDRLVEHPPDYDINYTALYEVIRDVDSLGLNFHALHLLYNGISNNGIVPENRKCRHLTLAGYPRWNPLTSSQEGLAFLSRITHLTLWLPMHEHPWLPPGPEGRRVPRWIEHVPFSSLPSLTHLAFSLRPEDTPSIHHHIYQDMLHVYTQTLVYVLPDGQNGPSLFRDWALGEKFLDHGIVVSDEAFCRPGKSDLGWEFLFMRGQPDATWVELDRTGASRSTELESLR